MTRSFTIVALFALVSVPALSGKKDKAPEPAATTAMDTAQAKAVVDYRKALYGSMGKHMKLSSMIVKGQVQVPSEDLVLHAQALHGAALSIPNLFPEGTGPDVFPSTEALPGVWTDRDGFEAAAKAYEAQAAKLVEVAKAGDLPGFKAQFGQVGRTCGGCHDSYRKDD